jgi:hypothetical protein
VGAGGPLTPIFEGGKMSKAEDILQKTLLEMKHADLVTLLLELGDEDESFRRKLSNRVTIPANLVRQQPANPQLVSRLKKDISNFFNNFYEHVSSYYETGPVDQVDDFLRDIEMLNPIDQLLVLPHLLEEGGNGADDNGYETSQLEAAFRMYGEAVAQLDLSPKDKLPHIDRLIGWLDESNIWEYGAQRKAVKEGLAALASTKEDYDYIIEQLEEFENEHSGMISSPIQDWLAYFYLKAGDEHKFLAIRQANLESEGQFYELADYWRSKGQTGKYLEALESWLTRQNQSGPANSYRYGAYSNEETGFKHGIIFEELEHYYRDNNEQENLLRILLGRARHSIATFELYLEVKTLAQKLDKWKQAQQQYLSYVRFHTDVLAQILVHEKEWDKALDLAREQSRYGYTTIDIIGQGLKYERPKEVIELYARLVKENIEQADRKHYNFAAGYAAKVKVIYLDILKEPQAWRVYVEDIREANKRRRALLDEFKAL